MFLFSVLDLLLLRVLCGFVDLFGSMVLFTGEYAVLVFMVGLWFV